MRSATGTRAARASCICPNHGGAIAINDWQWPYWGRFVVGHLGFKFWNWPPLSPDFMSQIGRVLGHRVAVTRGKA